VTRDEVGDFDRFYLASRDRLLHVLYAMTGDLAEAQDVLQEAYARAWQRWSTVSDYDEPTAWVRTVAWRLAVSRRRKARNRIGAALRLHATELPVAEPSPDTALIVAALRQLPETQRRALALHYLCDLSVEAVAAETGTSTGTVKSRLSRGRTALAAVITEMDGRTDVERARIRTEETVNG
jgi:RNA polymerase sigma-70 factor (ECF subfamily)